MANSSSAAKLHLNKITIASVLLAALLSGCATRPIPQGQQLFGSDVLLRDVTVIFVNATNASSRQPVIIDPVSFVLGEALHSNPMILSASLPRELLTEMTGGFDLATERLSQQQILLLQRELKTRTLGLGAVASGFLFFKEPAATNAPSSPLRLTAHRSGEEGAIRFEFSFK